MRIFKWRIGSPDACPIKDCKSNRDGKCFRSKGLSHNSNFPNEVMCEGYKCRVIYQNSFGEVDQKGIISLNRV